MAYRAYPPDARAHLTSIVMMVALLVPALSPALGGVIVDRASWRAIFFGMVPLAAATCVLAFAWLPPDAAGERPPALDARGLALSAVALVALLLGLTFAGQLGAAAWRSRRCRSRWSPVARTSRMRGARRPRCSTCASSRSRCCGSA